MNNINANTIHLTENRKYFDVTFEYELLSINAFVEISENCIDNFEPSVNIEIINADDDEIFENDEKLEKIINDLTEYVMLNLESFR